MPAVAREEKAEPSDFYKRILERFRERWPEKYREQVPTTKEVGKFFGKSQNSAWKWYHGGPPRMKTALAMAEKLDVCVQWLLQGDGPKFVATPNDVLIDALIVVATRLKERSPHLLIELVRYAQYIESGTAASG